ncbi:hypothetical protein V6Z11_A12G046000 [Gossypium hirsutum]|uniref:Uncharacterized protein n=1 Tax=Gossypium hirsutum TaxID=3635 RepID=A0A1U8LJ29_GOSHI|nr:uncharacterized protein LOC107927904 [Gossypium hirsutum]
MANGSPMVTRFCQWKSRPWRSARISLEISLQLRRQRSKEKNSMAFFARYGRTEEMTRMAWRLCAGISRGQPTLCCPSSVFQELLEFLAAEILFSFEFFWV